MRKIILAVMAIAGLACATTEIAMADEQVASELKTKTSNEIGLTVASYEYKEPDISMSQKATKVGIDYNGTMALSNDWFVRGDLRYATGKADYSSPASGTKNGNPDWYYELRGTFGRDFSMETYSLSPYTGLGYRYLFNDIRGATSTGAIGYRRESQYTYLPVGVTHRLKLESTARLSTTLEYDYLINGEQKSHFSDVTILYPDLTNNQHKGYGIRGSMYYEKDNWSFGPWFQYWNIDKSDLAPFTVTVLGVTYTGNVWEPKNTTTDVGLRLGYKF